WPYLLLGLVLWLFVLKSGVHATLAGVATALVIPITRSSAGSPSPLARLESALHPWVAYGVMPAFAFANAGVALAGITPATLVSGVPLGIALGLFLGKQIGAFGASCLAIGRVGRACPKARPSPSSTGPACWPASASPCRCSSARSPSTRRSRLLRCA